MVKINFDGAFNKNTSYGGTGIIIRDHDGFPLAAKSTKAEKVPDSFFVEALAAYQAVMFAMELGFTKVVFEGDALALIKILNSKKSLIYLWQVLLLIVLICCLVHFKKLSFMHVIRCANSPCSFLAKNDLKSERGDMVGGMTNLHHLYIYFRWKLLIKLFFVSLKK